MSKVLVVTNNTLVRDSFSDRWKVCFSDIDYVDVLCEARDLIHAGHILLTHPLAGSVKPGETPYRSVALSLEPSGTVDVLSLQLIEDAIVMAKRMVTEWGETYAGIMTDKKRADFRLVDYTVFNSAAVSLESGVMR